MPRKRTTEQQQVSEPMGTATLRAAGARLNTRAGANSSARSGRAWQDRCWDYYDVIGEYRYGADWVGSMLSRVTLYAAQDGSRTQEGSAADYVEALFGGPDQQPQLLRETGIHLTVAGEEYLIGWTAKGEDHWRVVASTEFTSRGGRYYISGKPIEGTGDPLVIRIWRPHPRRYREANSPSRAVLPILAELDILTKRIFAEIDSRLAGAGLLFVPSEITLPVALQGTDADGNPAGSGPGMATATQLQQALQSVMVTAVEDQSDAAALVPIVLTAPGDSIQHVKLQTFWSELDAVSIQLRTEAIRRLALGLDMPPEVLTGTADLTHWNAWQLEESGIKAHIEPVLGLITESLTQGYLWPLLAGDGMTEDEYRTYTIEADTAELRLRPNRSKEAVDLWQNMLLSDKTTLREVGFNPETDMPDANELRDRMVQKVAQGQTTPELVEAALRVLGVPFGSAPVVTESSAPAEARPDPSSDVPVTGPPQRTTTGPDQDGNPPAGEQMALIAASEVIVHRALERAGNRLRNRVGRKIDGVSAADTYLHVPVPRGMVDELLDDAFTNLDRFASCSAVDPDKLGAALEAYCRSLLAARKPVDTGDLAAYVEVARDATVQARKGVLIS
jgi:hypothetical protein